MRVELEISAKVEFGDGDNISENFSLSLIKFLEQYSTKPPKVTIKENKE